MTSVEMKLKQVRAASNQSHIFLYHMHFATLRIVRLNQFLNPTVRVILGVLCLQNPPSSCLVILRCVSVLKQDTREKMFSQGHQEKYKDVVKSSDTKAIGCPVQGWE